MLMSSCPCLKCPFLGAGMQLEVVNADGCDDMAFTSWVAGTMGEYNFIVALATPQQTQVLKEKKCLTNDTYFCPKFRKHKASSDVSIYGAIKQSTGGTTGGLCSPTDPKIRWRLFICWGKFNLCKLIYDFWQKITHTFRICTFSFSRFASQVTLTLNVFHLDRWKRITLDYNGWLSLSI